MHQGNYTHRRTHTDLNHTGSSGYPTEADAVGHARRTGPADTHHNMDRRTTCKYTFSSSSTPVATFYAPATLRKLFQARALRGSSRTLSSSSAMFQSLKTFQKLLIAFFNAFYAFSPANPISLCHSLTFSFFNAIMLFLPQIPDPFVTLLPFFLEAQRHAAARRMQHGNTCRVMPIGKVKAKRSLHNRYTNAELKSAGRRSAHRRLGPCPWDHAALRDLGFSGKGEMKTSSLGRTVRALARPWTAIKRSISMSRIGNGLGTLPPSARANLVCPALRMAWLPPTSISPPTVQIEPVRHENVSAHARHTRVHPTIPIPSHLIGFVSLYPDG